MKKKSEIISTIINNKNVNKEISFLATKNMPNYSKYEWFFYICMLTQEELKQYLFNKMVKIYGESNTFNEDGFLYCKGTIPFCLIAHMDTVHKKTCSIIRYTVDKAGQTEDEDSLSFTSPEGIGGDDRCGVYMILQLLKSNYRPSIIFCEDEETGLVGAGKFVKTNYIEDLKSMNMLIEFDRKDKDDAVFYSCDNPEFTKYITTTTGYKERYGSCSDISTIAPACGVAAVNLSCGYYGAHTTNESVKFDEMLNTVEIVKKILNDESCVPYKYIKKTYSSYNSSSSSSYYGGGYYGVYDYDDYYDMYGGYYGRQLSQSNKEKKKSMYHLVIHFEDIESAATVEANIFRSQKNLEPELCLLGAFFKEHPNACYNDIIKTQLLKKEMNK